MEYKVTNSSDWTQRVLSTEELLKIYKGKTWKRLALKIQKGYEHIRVEITPIGHIIYFDKI